MLQLTFNPTNPACPVMAFMVDQATRQEPVALVGTPGRRHASAFWDNSEPDPGMDEMLARVFGGSSAVSC
jgi:hypothetical protein